MREKAPKDIVTEVDLLCEELMVSAIRERYPDDAILSEEQGGEISATGRTANPKYYAGGDCVSGGREVVDAVADGKRAAGGMLSVWAG